MNDEKHNSADEALPEAAASLTPDEADTLAASPIEESPAGDDGSASDQSDPAANPAPESGSVPGDVAADSAKPKADIEPITYKISDKVVVATEPSSPMAESIAALRTHLLSHHYGRGRRGIAMCSPSSQSGTTYVAVNLAVSFARTGLNTLLIDANLREPAVHNMIVPSREMPSLKFMLNDPTGEYGAVIQENVMPNLSIIYSGGTSTHAQELLSGARFKSLIDLCMREFDMTIVDTPAGNTNADGRRVASVMRHAIIIARKDWTYVSDVRMLIDELQAGQVNVAGTVYNEY